MNSAARFHTGSCEQASHSLARQAVPQQLTHVLLATPSSSVPLSCTADSTSSSAECPFTYHGGSARCHRVQLLQLDTTTLVRVTPLPTECRALCGRELCVAVAQGGRQEERQTCWRATPTCSVEKHVPNLTNCCMQKLA